METFKPGDIIRRKDMPSIRYKVLGPVAGWQNMTEITLVSHNRGLRIKTGMIDSNDDRWEKVNES